MVTGYLARSIEHLYRYQSGLGAKVIVLNTTFNNISAISKWSVFIDGGNRCTRRKRPICRKSLTNFITKCCIEYTSPWAGFELTNLVVTGTVSIGSCKSNYHTITTTWSLEVAALFMTFSTLLHTRGLSCDMFTSHP